MISVAGVRALEEKNNNNSSQLWSSMTAAPYKVRYLSVSLYDEANSLTPLPQLFLSGLQLPTAFWCKEAASPKNIWRQL